MIKEEDIYPVGKFQKTHALKGELNMISDIDPEYFLEGHPLIVDYDGIYVPYYSETIRKKGSTSYLIKLDGIDDEKSASEFVNKEIYIIKKDAEELLGDDIENLDSLLGYEVIEGETGITLGKIESIDDSTINLLFILKNEEGEEIILPANDDFIEEIDDEEGIIKMVLPQGLINLNKNEKNKDEE